MIKQRHIPVGRSYAIAMTLVGLLVAASAGAAPSRATTSLTTPRTLYIEHGKIHKFAQDGSFITWVGGRHYVVHLRSLSGRGSWVLGNAGVGGAVGAESASTLVLGGKRAVWVKYAGVMTREAVIYTAKPGQKKPMLIDAPGVTDYGGTYLTGLAADGEGTIVYGDARVTCEPGTGCSNWSLTEGGVHRFAGKSYPPRIHGIPPAFAIAASTGRVAVVPAVLTDPERGSWGAAPDGPVDVYNLSGRRLVRVVPQGTVRDVALSWPDLAVIVARSDGTTVIERYDAARGELVGTTKMPGARDLAVGTGGIVFRVQQDDLHDSRRKDRSSVARDEYADRALDRGQSGRLGGVWADQGPGPSVITSSTLRAPRQRPEGRFREDSSHARGFAGGPGSASPPRARRRARDDARRARVPGGRGPGGGSRVRAGRS